MAPLLELENLSDALKGLKRPSSEGPEAIKNLLVVATREKNTARAVINALCLRTTKIDEPPVKISVIINKITKAVNDKIVEISCTCPAGASKEHVCKHAFATLMYLQRHEEDALTVLTCTDLDQMWGTLQEDTLARFEPAPLKDFCHVKKPPLPYKKTIGPVTKEMEEQFRSMYIADQPESEAAIFLSGSRAPPVPLRNAEPTFPSADVLKLLSILQRAIDIPHFLLKRTAEISLDLLSQCTPEEQQFYKENVAVTTNECLQMCVDTVGQDNELWMLFKYGRITGSICYSMYTYSKNESADWNKRFQCTFQSSFDGDANTKRGLMYENEARERFVKENEGISVVTSGIFVHPLLPWLGFSPDGLVCNDSEPLKLWECKCPLKGETLKASAAVPYLSYLDKKYDNHLKKKHQYYGQVQLGMVLFNLCMADFTVYSTKYDDIHVDTVPIDEPFLHDLLDRLANIYFKKLLPWLVKNPKKD